MTNDESRLFERAGGDAGIVGRAEDFYRRVFADPELRPIYEGADVEQLERLQRLLFRAALGAVPRDDGSELAALHHGLGVHPKHFARLTGHLLDTLADLELDEAERDGVRSRLATWADAVTGDAGVAG